MHSLITVCCNQWAAALEIISLMLFQHLFELFWIIYKLEELYFITKASLVWKRCYNFFFKYSTKFSTNT